MTKHKYIVAMKREDAALSKLFRNYFAANGLAYWHWIENVWLIVDPRPNKTVIDIRKEIHNFAPSDQFLVFNVGAGQWSGMGVTTSDKNMFTWLHDTWE